MTLWGRQATFIWYNCIRALDFSLTGSATGFDGTPSQGRVSPSVEVKPSTSAVLWGLTGSYGQLDYYTMW